MMGIGFWEMVIIAAVVLVPLTVVIAVVAAVVASGLSRRERQ
jgi:hypothetical protein